MTDHTKPLQKKRQQTTEVQTYLQSGFCETSVLQGSLYTLIRIKTSKKPLTFWHPSLTKVTSHFQLAEWQSQVSFFSVVVMNLGSELLGSELSKKGWRKRKWSGFETFRALCCTTETCIKINKSKMNKHCISLVVQQMALVSRQTLH